MQNLNYKILLKYVILVLSNAFCVMLYKKILFTDELMIDEFAKNMNSIDLEGAIEQFEKWSWVNYFIQPIIITIKVTLVSVCLLIGILFYETDKKIKFKSVLNIVLLAEFVFLASEFIKIFILSLNKYDITLSDIKYYRAFSTINFFNIYEIEEWKAALLESINLFEVLYVFVLSYGLIKVLNSKFWRSFEITAISYGIGVLLWTLLYSGILFYFSN